MLEKSRLLRPLLFLSIKGIVEFKWMYTSILTILSIIYIYIYPTEINFQGKDSWIAAILSCLQVLPGFYIAALAAIATFPNINLDRPLDGDEVSVYLSEDGVMQKVVLTRRRFLCFTFGYLSFSSILLLLLCSWIQLATPTLLISTVLNKALYVLTVNLYINQSTIDFIALSIILFILYQIVCVTLLGLFYLTDRIHWRIVEEVDDSDQ